MELPAKVWAGWKGALIFVKPGTVIRWHRRAFKLYWCRESRAGKRGRPALDSDVRALILKMADANPLWGAPKIHGELPKLGIVVSERTVSGVLRRHKRKPPSQTWRTFIKNHMPDMVGVDFLVVPTIRFRLLYLFVVLSHVRHRVVHFNVRANPAPATVELPRLGGLHHRYERSQAA